MTDWQAPVLRLPYRGAPQTVGLIRESAHKAQQDVAVRQLAEAVCSGLPSKAYLDEYAALYRFVESRTRYMRDPRTVELVRSPSVVVQSLWAGQVPQLDCDDMACQLCFRRKVSSKVRVYRKRYKRFPSIALYLAHYLDVSRRYSQLLRRDIDG